MTNPQKRKPSQSGGTLHPSARPGENYIVPSGATPIVGDTSNPYGYRDKSGREYNYLNQPAWEWSSSGPRETKRINPMNRPDYVKDVKMQVAPSRPPSDTLQQTNTGAPAGGQAGSPDSSDTVGNMNSQSGAPATKYGQGKSQPPPQKQKSLDAPAAPGETLPFQLTTTPTTDAGTVKGGGVDAQVQSRIAPNVQLSPIQWDAISRMQPRAVGGSWIEPMRNLQQPNTQIPLNIPTPAYPTMAETEEDPWWKRYLRAIFG